MKIIEKGNHVVLSNLKAEEIFAFLKIQIKSNIIFLNKNNQRLNVQYTLINRDYINNEYVIEYDDIDDNSHITSYKELLDKFSKAMSNSYTLHIMIESNEYKNKEALINLIPNIKKEIVSSCIYIDYDIENSIFEVKNKPFKNNDSDKMYYFEINDTILGFSENGPILITDSPNVNSIEDVICN